MKTCWLACLIISFLPTENEARKKVITELELCNPTNICSFSHLLSLFFFFCCCSNASILSWLMDYLANISVPSDYQQEKVLFAPPTCSVNGGFSSSLDDLLASQSTEADVSLEWLSVFVEDCLSSSGNCLPPPAVKTSQNLKDLHFQKSHQNHLPNFTVPGKPRSKRSERHRKHKLNPNRQYGQNLFQAVSLEPPPLLDQQQTHWFSGSELVSVPKKETKEVEGTGRGEEKKGSKERRCSHCLSQRTPQWRAGPLGPKTLCNACGVRYKSGRLLPEYRPAKSPTFVSFLHSNSHKKVMEMRSMTALP